MSNAVAQPASKLRVPGCRRPRVDCHSSSIRQHPPASAIIRHQSASGAGGPLFSHSPQCLHLMAAARISSAQKGHNLVGSSALGSGASAWPSGSEDDTGTAGKLALSSLSDPGGDSTTRFLAYLLAPARKSMRISRYKTRAMYKAMLKGRTLALTSHSGPRAV